MGRFDARPDGVPHLVPLMNADAGALEEARRRFEARMAAIMQDRPVEPASTSN